MGYLSCRADSSIATCRSISVISPHRSKLSSDEPPNEVADLSPPNPAAIRRFSFEELAEATSNFADSSLLGRGSHGAVYKALIPPSSIPVAVKRASKPDSPQLSSELSVLSSIRSGRIVNLVGFADTTTPDNPGERLVVFELMPNGTLYDLLHSNARPPGWQRRMRLALQTAKALRSLHAASPPVVHRDVKSANILIDADHNARLADFGLALRVVEGEHGTPPPPAGTLGYLDPAYVTPENLSTKTDVFSFGILLLEIVSGRKAIDVVHSPPSVVEWAVPLLRKGKVSALFDPRIPLPRDPEARRGIAFLAANCVRSSTERRPTMAEVVHQLKLLSRSLPASSGWNGLSVVVNPCAVVDTEKAVVKLARSESPDLQRKLKSVSGISVGGDAVEAKGSLVSYMGTTAKRPPRPPLRTARVFSESVAGSRAAGKQSRNLKELMARADDQSTPPGAEISSPRHNSGTSSDLKEIVLRSPCQNHTDSVNGIGSSTLDSTKLVEAT